MAMLWPNPTTDNNTNTFEQSWVTVTPTVYPSNGTVTTPPLQWPIDTAVTLQSMYDQLLKLVTGCCVCGNQEVFLICAMCREAVIHARQKMVDDVIQTMQEMEPVE